jgi:antagonist of KipI
MSIKIIKPSIVSMLVSDGREGFRALGIGPNGAMDSFAMKAANFLVGNEQEAVIEIGYSSMEIQFSNDHLISITGRGFEVNVNDQSIPLWRPFKIKRESVLKLKKTSGGAWAYLAVRGGWESQKWLKSFTTNVNAKAGGFNGRVLQKDDVIESDESKNISEAGTLNWGISTIELNEVYAPANVIRCIPSIETELLSVLSKEKFNKTDFIITSQSNRMGYRLKGESLDLKERRELISSAVDFGTIQLLPDGNLIVLMADHQTTGGYPRIASVIKADLPKLSQQMPSEKINFTMTSFEQAEAALFSREQKLIELKKSCHMRMEKYFLQ